MANKTSLVITSTDQSGKTFNKTYTCVNASASADNLKAFAQGLNGLTKNTFDSAALIERTEIVDKTELPLAHVEFTIGDRTYTEADADMTQEYPTLTLAFDESDTRSVKTNRDNRKEVQFEMNYVETWALGVRKNSDSTTPSIGRPLPVLTGNPYMDVCNDKLWGTYHSTPPIFVRCEFADEGTNKDDPAYIAIGGTKTRRGWLISIKLNRGA